MDQLCGKNRKLEIEVHETLRRLIVAMPGIHYTMEFAQIESRLGLVCGFGHDDENARISSSQFASLAETTWVDGLMLVALFWSLAPLAHAIVAGNLRNSDSG